MVETKRICNGTFGELWLDSDYVGECYKAQATTVDTLVKLNGIKNKNLIYVGQIIKLP